MNAVVTQTKTMSSREIAVLTGKEHKNVIRDIRAMLDELRKDGSILIHAQEDKDSRGYTTCFHLNRELTDTLLTGYSASARLKVIQRWHELETKSESQQDQFAMLPPEQRALIALMCQNAELKATQDKQSTDIARLEETVAVMEARAQPENRHFTVMGWANLNNRKIDFREASSHGRQCARLSREQGMPIGDVTDPRFGKVHSYHESILIQVPELAALQSKTQKAASSETKRRAA